MLTTINTIANITDDTVELLESAAESNADLCGDWERTQNTTDEYDRSLKLVQKQTGCKVVPLIARLAGWLENSGHSSNKFFVQAIASTLFLHLEPVMITL